MIIKLTPQRRDDALVAVRAGNTISVNGEVFDFSPMADGDTLPAAAIRSPWFMGQVDKVGEELELGLILPLPINYSPEQAFPDPLLNVQDGVVTFPQPLPSDEDPVDPELMAPRAGFIDWSQLITVQMKAEELRLHQITQATAQAESLRLVADQEVSDLQDVVDIDEAGAEEVALLKIWKKYRVALAKIDQQPGYPSAIEWPPLPS